MTTTASTPTPTAAQAAQGSPGACDGPSAAAPHWESEPGQTSGLYGPRGWTVNAGVWLVLADFRDALRSDAIPAAFGHPAAGLIVDGVPRDDYTPFHGLDGSGAARLREAMKDTPEALTDRQNLSPSLGRLLDACEAAEGRMVLSGYGIGPQRNDERVTVEALWVADPDLLAMDVTDSHEAGCQCRDLWKAVRERYGLDAEAMPDEIRKCPRPASTQPPTEMGWWMWWD